MFDFMADVIFILVGSVAGPLGGSIGGAVVALSLGFRLALTPLTYVAARRAAERRRVRAAIQPEIERIEREHAADPQRRAVEVAQAHARAGLLDLEPVGLLALLVQIPVVGGLLAATGRGLGAGVRFLGIANLGAPSLLAATVATLLILAGAAVTLAPHNDPRLLVFWFMVWLSLAWAVPAVLALHRASLGLVTVGEAVAVRLGSNPPPANAA